MTRRQAVAGLSALAACGAAGALRGAESTPEYRVATFSADITCPLGHPLMGGGIKPAEKVVDPLLAHGFVLLGAGNPLVVCVLDWCEVRNDAYDRWREALAQAAGTERQWVFLSCIHQHDAPITDLTAQRLLDEAGAAGDICMPDFHEQAVERVAAALKDSLGSARRVTHVGTGQAQVDQVASNRRYVLPDGSLGFSRTSATRDPAIRELDGGLIDPWLKTLSLWDGDSQVLGLHAYAVHPMSYYGQGGVSYDFTGMARARRQKDDARVFQMYASGCSGNVTAGKYNDGSPENRAVLADRIYQAMVAAEQATQRTPLESLAYTNESLTLAPRSSPGFTPEDLQQRLTTDERPFGQCLAALGLSWRKRCEAGQPIDVPCIHFGPAQLLLLPAESYVEHQLYAQSARADSFVVTLGYGECGPGYIPTEKHWQENDGNLGDWCWVDPGAEERMQEVIRRALQATA
jgi:hypothetical protein